MWVIWDYYHLGRILQRNTELRYKSTNYTHSSRISDLAPSLLKPTPRGESVRVGIAVFGSRISSLFDTAEKLLLVDIVNNEETGREEVAMDGTLPFRRVRCLGDLGVTTLLCGAISGVMYSLIAARGITVIPWLKGEVNEVLDGFRNGTLHTPYFRLPGPGGPFRGRHGWAWRHETDASGRGTGERHQP